MQLTIFQALTTSFLLSLAQAQYVVDPNSVPQSIRDYWCMNQITQCPLICMQDVKNTAVTKANQCNSKSLTYSCVCSDGLSPNISEYSQTLPFFTCQEWGNQCVSNCGSDSTCAYNCRANHPCGALNPKRVNLTTATTALPSSTSAVAGAIYSGFGAGSAKSAQTGNAASSLRASAMAAGQSFGTLAVIGAFVGGFAIML